MVKGGLTMSIDYQATILRIRAELNLSQMELAEVLGVSFTSVNRWENGRYQPTNAIKKRIELLCEKHNIKVEKNN